MLKKNIANKFMNYSHTLGLCTMEGRGFMFPVDTAFSNDGRMHTISRAYPAVSRNLRVTIYDTESDFFGVYGGFGEDLGQFRWPTAITAHQNGDIYVSDEKNNRITIYGIDGTPKKSWGITGSNPGELNGPAGICFNKNNELIISDHKNNRIQKFTSDGEFISLFGNETNRNINLNLPWGITISSNDYIYVADWGNHQIAKFSSDGNLLQRFGNLGTTNGDFKNPSSVAVDKNEYIYVADWGNERVQIFDPNGTWVETLRGEATLSKWGEEFMLANQEEALPRSKSNLEPNISQFKGDPYEESAHIEKLFWGPVSVKLDKDDILYVTESNRHRIQVYKKNN
tara:strand:- start:2304 stop:3326 length:1023 start_codon:yes stop_codon:yes gene_type:complete